MFKRLNLVKGRLEQRSQRDRLTSAISTPINKPEHSSGLARKDRNGG